MLAAGSPCAAFGPTSRSRIAAGLMTVWLRMRSAIAIAAPSTIAMPQREEKTFSSSRALPLAKRLINPVAIVISPSRRR